MKSVRSKRHCSELFYLPAHASMLPDIWDHVYCALKGAWFLLEWRGWNAREWRYHIPARQRWFYILTFPNTNSMKYIFQNMNLLWEKFVIYSEHFPVVCRLWNGKNTVMKLKNLLLQNHWANFNHIWHKTSFGEGNSWRTIQFLKRR